MYSNKKNKNDFENFFLVTIKKINTRLYGAKTKKFYSCDECNYFGPFAIIFTSNFHKYAYIATLILFSCVVYYQAVKLQNNIKENYTYIKTHFEEQQIDIKNNDYPYLLFFQMVSKISEGKDLRGIKILIICLSVAVVLIIVVLYVVFATMVIFWVLAIFFRSSCVRICPYCLTEYDTKNYFYDFESSNFINVKTRSSIE